MLNGIKSKALLTGIMAVSILISGCGVKKDSDDKVMLVIDESITEVTSNGKESLLDIRDNGATYWQYDQANKLLISSSWGTNVSIHNMETGAETVIGFPEISGRYDEIEYEGKTMVARNAWYEEGKVSIYAEDPDDHTLVVFTFDCETEELEDSACYDIESPDFVRDTGNFLVYVKSVYSSPSFLYDLNIYDKTTGEDKTIASDIGKLGAGFPLIVLNGDKSKVLFADTTNDAPVLNEYDIPSGEIREVYKCSKRKYITGFTYALESDKIYLRYGKKFDLAVGYTCLPNYTMVITPDDRNYDLYYSSTEGYDFNDTGIVVN